MMQSELLIQPSWPISSYFPSNPNQYDPNIDFYKSQHLGFQPSISTTPENSSPFSPASYFPMLSDELVEYDPLFYDDQMQNVSENTMEGLEDVCKWLCDDDQATEETPFEKSTEGEELWSPSLSTKSSDAMEIGHQKGLESLLKAYGEAMGLGQIELAKVIVKRIRDKSNAVGKTLERIALNLFNGSEIQGEEYLKQESRRNFKAAFRAFYEIFPYGKMAHFTANSAILEAISSHVDSIHIVDFDLGQGIQWPPVIEAIVQKRKSLKITSVKLEEDENGFEETKRQLLSYGTSCGLKLEVEEIDLAQLANQIEETRISREFLAFNCMIGLPHMGGRRRRTQVIEFLKIAQMLLAKTEGILTFGDGEDGERTGNSSDFGSFFEGYLGHYKALYESIEWGFPSYLNEARVTMETLFVAPYVSSLDWFKKWEEQREVAIYQSVLRLKGRRMSKESLNEAKEMVKEGESPYKITVKGDDENVMVLEWRGTPLVRMSAWM